MMLSSGLGYARGSNPAILHSLSSHSTKPRVSNIHATTALDKLSPEGNKFLKDQYYAEVTKGILPVSQDDQPTYHIVNAMPSAGKSTVMRMLKQNNPHIAAVERDDMIMRHPRVGEAMKENVAKWARILRKLEGIDDYADGEMIDRFMQDRYNIAQGVVGDINKHVGKAELYKYRSDVHLVMIPKYVAKLRSIQRFLTSPTGSPDRRLILSSQYDKPDNGYEALQKKNIKAFFNKYPGRSINVTYETGDNDQKHRTTINSYDAYLKLFDKVNRLPKTKEARDAFNKLSRTIREQFLEEYPEPTKNMPEDYRQEALDLAKGLPAL